MATRKHTMVGKRPNGPLRHAMNVEFFYNSFMPSIENAVENIYVTFFIKNHKLFLFFLNFTKMSATNKFDYDLDTGIIADLYGQKHDPVTLLRHLKTMYTIHVDETKRLVGHNWTGYLIEVRSNRIFVAVSSDGAHIKCQCYPERCANIFVAGVYLLIDFNRLVTSFTLVTREYAAEEQMPLYSPSFDLVSGTVAEVVITVENLSARLHNPKANIGKVDEAAVEVEVAGEIWIGYMCHVRFNTLFVAVSPDGRRVKFQCFPPKGLMKALDLENDFNRIVTSFTTNNESAFAFIDHDFV